jgi:predicted transcriptional regulator
MGEAPAPLSVGRIAAVVGISRQTLARHVRERHVSADAFEGNRALFRRESAPRVKIKRPGLPETRIQINLADVAATVEEFQAIGEDPERFAAFVNVRAHYIKLGDA